MASLNTSTNGPSIKSSYQSVIDSSLGADTSSPTLGQWALFSVSTPLVNAFQPDRGGKESILKVQSTGVGELSDLIDEFSEGRIQFAFVKIRDSNTKLPKFVLIGWCGEGVPERTKGYFTTHLVTVSKIFHGYHVQITARSDRDLTPDSIVKKVADASGAKYSSGSNSSAPVGPTLASKPVYTPSKLSSATGANPLLNPRSRFSHNNKNVDDDGWEADAPQVTRSQLEKVAPAYKPTKVNMAELTRQKSDTSQVNGFRKQNENDGIVKGGYQPVGRVDIAAIRAQAQNKSDDRPTIVKGAYEPVGKVDIAAIRAKAQKPSNDLYTSASVSSTSQSNNQSSTMTLADRSAVFSQSERLTTLPKPKIANKFGSNSSNFTGTKAPQPGGFGSQFPPTTFVPPPVGTVSKTFADEGGKTPAQLWQEKKVRERANSGTIPTTPTKYSQESGHKNVGGLWKSGYTGKSWAPVATDPTGRSGSSSIEDQHTGDQIQDRETNITSPSGISVPKNQVQTGSAVKTNSIITSLTSDQSPPLPSINTSNKPPNIPPPPPLPPQESDPISDSPQRESSPILVAMPVARDKDPDSEVPKELEPITNTVPTSFASEVRGKDSNYHDTDLDAVTASGVSITEINNTPFENHDSSTKRICAIIIYDYEVAEDNEIQLIENEYITNIDMVDDDWWVGTNSRGETGLFPSNYVELVEELPNTTTKQTTPAKKALPTATALYDYEAAEDNELTFEENAVITNVEFPDEDWWHGIYNGKSGLFPANYVQLNE